MLDGAPSSTMRSQERKADRINLHNAETREVALSRYPVGSIREISPPMGRGARSYSRSEIGISASTKSRGRF